MINLEPEKKGRGRPIFRNIDLPLTPREREALLLLADDMPYKQIADRMDISPSTVKFFLRRAYKKLGVTTSHGAVAKLLRSMS